MTPDLGLGRQGERDRRSNPSCRSSIRTIISGSAPATTTCSTTCWPTPDRPQHRRHGVRRLPFDVPQGRAGRDALRRRDRVRQRRGGDERQRHLRQPARLRTASSAMSTCASAPRRARCSTPRSPPATALQRHPLLRPAGRRPGIRNSRTDPTPELTRDKTWREGFKELGQARPHLRRLALPSADRRDRRPGRRLSRHRRSSSTMSAGRSAMPAMPAATTRCAPPGRSRWPSSPSGPTSRSRWAGSAWRWAGFDFYQRPTPPGSQELADRLQALDRTCIELFGVERCMFESNFPVDKVTVGLRRAVERLQAAGRQGLGRREEGAVFGHRRPRLQALKEALP